MHLTPPPPLLNCLYTLHSSHCRDLSACNACKDAFSNTVCLLVLHLTCVNILIGVPRHLGDTEVAPAIQMLQGGSSQRNVTGAFNVTRAWFVDNEIAAKPLVDMH